MLTNIMRWIRRRITRPAVLPDEYHAERMDAGWHPEYLNVRRGGPSDPIWVFGLLPR